MKRGRERGKALSHQPQLSLQLLATVSKASADVTQSSEELSLWVLPKL